MQRLGGGGYTRKRNQRAGGAAGPSHPADPTCGCDMQAGWPKFLTENIPLPTMKGGGSCGIPPIPNYYQGGQRGGACGACAGLPLPTPLQQGGGPPFYNSNPVPDACPFPGTGYCNFYAKGGSKSNENIDLGHKLMNKEEFAMFLAFYGKPSPHAQILAGKPKTKQFDEIYEAGKELQKAKVANLDEARALKWIRDKKEGLPMFGGANYGEPMNLQARLRGGANYGEPMNLQARLRGGAQELPLALSAPQIARQDERRKQLSQAIRLLQQEGKPLRAFNIREKMRQMNAKIPSSAAPMATPVLAPQNGGGCGCGLPRGGYRPTKKNLNALKKWRKGQSIGFTMTSSLKAKGLIPRTSKKNRGKKVVSAKYK